MNSELLARRHDLVAAETKSGAEGQAPVYMCSFNWTIPAENGVLGAPHAVDIPFAFGNTDRHASLVDGLLSISLKREF